MQKNIRKMMSARFQPVELAIQHMRDGRQRMPVLGMNMCEGPRDTRDSETACYFRILIDVVLIIVVNELVPERLAKNQPHDKGKKNADAGRGPGRIGFGQDWQWRIDIREIVSPFAPAEL